MKFGRRSGSRSSRLSVVVPVYDVEDYLPACLDSILGQPAVAPGSGVELEVVVVDDGSPDSSGVVADAYAARDPRVRVVHTDNHGLGAARNEGVRHATGDLLAFVDSDDVLAPDAYSPLLRQRRRTGADVVTGSMAWWEGDTLREPPWMRRLHHDRRAVVIEQHPELLGDVFAWNKLFDREFYDGYGLTFPAGLRYEDQPLATVAYLRARRIGVVPDVVYHWRIRTDGTSITQQRATLADLHDRFETKRMALRAVEAYGAKQVTTVFTERVLPGDLHRYFVLIPGCDDAWWEALRSGVLEFFSGHSLARSGLPPVHRLTGWLVEQGRRDDATLVMRAFLALGPGEALPRVEESRGRRLDVPGLDARSVPFPVLALRDHER